MPIDSLTKILDRPISDYDGLSRWCIEQAQREWAQTHVTNLDGSNEHKQFVMSRARELRGVDRPAQPASGYDLLRLNGGASNLELPHDAIRREELERGRQGDFGQVSESNRLGGHHFAPEGDYDKSGKTYGRISTRPSPKFPWQNKADLRR